MRTSHNPFGPHAEGHVQTPFEKNIDSYKNTHKLSEPTVCQECGAVYHQGRWQWMDAPASAEKQTCPACRRVHDDFPAGFITLSGSFFKAHEAEIRQLIQHRAEHERAEHPLKRIISIKEQEGTVIVTTTDTHLAKGIGQALHDAYHGTLEVKQTPGEYLVRIQWSR